MDRGSPISSGDLKSTPRLLNAESKPLSSLSLKWLFQIKSHPKECRARFPKRADSSG
jgi:hypothetical protein